jgi:hypothetical protein
LRQPWRADLGHREAILAGHIHCLLVRDLRRCSQPTEAHTLLTLLTASLALCRAYCTLLCVVVRPMSDGVTAHSSSIGGGGGGRVVVVVMMMMMTMVVAQTHASVPFGCNGKLNRSRKCLQTCQKEVLLLVWSG